VVIDRRTDVDHQQGNGHEHEDFVNLAKQFAIAER